MPWFLEIDTTTVAVVKLDVNPPCPQLSPPLEYYKENDIMYAYGKWTRYGIDIADKYWPISAKIKTARKDIPDLTGICSFWSVSQKFLDCVESLEPGTHEFRKVDIYRKDGSPYGENYYAMNIRSIVNDAIAWDQTTVPYKEISGKKFLRGLLNKSAYHVTMIRSKLDKRHLWISHEVILGGIVVSDELYSLLFADKLLTGLQSLHIDLV